MRFVSSPAKRSPSALPDAGCEQRTRRVPMRRRDVGSALFIGRVSLVQWIHSRDPQQRAAPPAPQSGSAQADSCHCRRRCSPSSNPPGAFSTNSSSPVASSSARRSAWARNLARTASRITSSLTCSQSARSSCLVRPVGRSCLDAADPPRVWCLGMQRCTQTGKGRGSFEIAGPPSCLAQEDAPWSLIGTT